MAQKLPYSITPGAVSVLVGGSYRVIPNNHANHGALVAALRKKEHDVELICELADISTFVARVTHGDVQISDDKVRWKGEDVHGVIVDRILEHLKLGYDLEPLVNFLGRVQQNPLEAAKEELFEWLEAGNAPITPDGYFIAFKKVRPDYKDIHSGTFDNSVGQVCQMPREHVDPDRRNECSRGLHFCSFGYLGNFGSSYPGDRVMLVKVDPADVVAIPNDYNRQKGRTWRYEVIGECDEAGAPKLFEGRPVVEPVAQDTAPVGEAAKDVVFQVGAQIVCTDDEGYEDFLSLSGVYTVIDCDHEEVLVVDDTSVQDWFAVTRFKLSEVQNTTSTVEETVNDGEGQKPAEKMFTASNGNSYLGSEITNLVKEHGQRGTCRLTGLARSTLQGWLAQIG